MGKQKKRKYNCTMSRGCPLEGNCLAENIVHLAKTEVKNRNSVNEEKLYIGTTENEWKEDIIIIN